jgi:very-short-patch-repair endonuclease
MRKYPTASEKILWENYLRKVKPRITRQKVILNYIVDFYCTKRKLIIEVDGDIHKQSLTYDNIRDRMFSEIGIQTIRVNNNDVLHNLGQVIKFLNQQILKSPSPA